MNKQMNMDRTGRANRLPLNAIAAIRQVPRAHQETVINNAIPELVKFKIRPWEWNHLRLMLQYLPQGQRASFFQYAARELVLRKLSDAHWHRLRKILRQVPESARRLFFQHVIPGFLDLGLNPPALERCAGSLAGLILFIHANQHDTLVRQSATAFLKTQPNEEDFHQQISLARTYHELLGRQGFASKVIAENFGQLPPLEAKGSETLGRFAKTGGKLIPLLGRRTGTILRVLREEPFLLWQKAEHRGIDVEPIVQKIRLPDGRVVAVTKYIGPSGEEHLEQHPEDRELVDQKRKERDRELLAEGIRHGHLTRRNVTVRRIGNNLRVTAIDFDGATKK